MVNYIVVLTHRCMEKVVKSVEVGDKVSLDFM